MAISGFDVAIWHLIAFVLAVVYRQQRDFASRRLRPDEIVAQIPVVRDLILYGLRGTPAREEDIEDLTQDVMLSAWLASEGDRYRPDPAVPPARALQAWLWGIAHHHVDHHLDSAHLRREQLTASPPALRQAQQGADYIVEREQMRLALLAALLELPEGQAAVIIAHDIEEEDMKSIAARLGTPVSTVYKWRVRGIVALEQALRPLRE